MAGAAAAFAEETETVDLALHVPKDWNSSAPGFTSGGAAYPLALARPDGSSVVSQATWGAPGAPALYDPNEKVSAGRINLALIRPDVGSGSELDQQQNQQPQLSAEWKVNGRFIGILHIPEAPVRANPAIGSNPSLTLKVAQGELSCTTAPLLPWTGQAWSSSGCWSYETRLPAPRLVPQTGVRAEGFKVAGGWLSLEADISRLTLRLEPPAGKTVTVSVNLKCVASPTGVCVS